MTLPAVALDDKYAKTSGQIYLTGLQALVRLAMMQRRRDLAAGLNTAGFISGYRGSPLGSLDQAAWRAKRFLDDHHVVFQPGINEDLAATAVWGTQQVNLWPGAKYDGVFSMWYGKGPGVDRSGDVFRHANSAGTAPHGGVLVLAGDDHASKSSTVAHQSEYGFVSAMMPILNPANVQEVLDLGLYGWAMSRYSGCWIGFKILAENADSSASVSIDSARSQIRLPTDFEMPPGGLNIRLAGHAPLAEEQRLMRHKLYAAIAFARANGLDRIIFRSPKHTFGIVTCGKSYLDVRQALEDLDIDEARAHELGISLFKVALTWPLDPEGVRAFAENLDELIVVEEKRALIENQLKEQLYNWRADRRPVIVGKFDEQRDWILPSTGELSPGQIAVVIGRRLLKRIDDAALAERVAFLEAKERQKVGHQAPISRLPYFCSGCPHNTSTNVPEGSRALAGIGCHYMVTWMDRRTEATTQMGGEGATWIGQSPFTETQHVFTNLGDGTYFHSGILAIRAAVAAKVNITYKLLYNDAVAMTGGQPVDGQLTVPAIVRQLEGEGVARIIVVTDDTEKYRGALALPAHTRIEHRDVLDRVQREMREIQGVSVLLYDQTCAAEKRRRRKRGLMADPPRRIFINERVCEGCGDCGDQSNCLSILPVETEFGRKRQIDQSTCNKDYSCAKGFCPSFVEVVGGTLRKSRAAKQATGEDALPLPPEPKLPELNRPYGILVTGIGGTGVVTIGALLGVAAHLEGKACNVLDQTGLAQKGGAVVSHVRIAPAPEDLHAVRIAGGGARLVLGCDLVVAAGGEVLSKIKPGVTAAVVNRAEAMTGAFTHQPDFRFPADELLGVIGDAVGGAPMHVVDASALAMALFGDSIATNLFMVGYAYQHGLIPVSGEAIERAIEANGVAVEMNTQAFQWGRRAAHDLSAVEHVVALASEVPAEHRRQAESLDEAIERRARDLAAYQNEAYAARYRNLLASVREAEASIGGDALSRAVARYLYKLMAYKDEYEVARLYTDGEFLRHIRAQFDGDIQLRFHLAPPLVADRDPETGHLVKRTYGPWMMRAFRLMAKLKGLRGTRWDVFGRTAERRTERQLIADYEATVAALISGLAPHNHDLAVEIASIPEDIRGFGHVKERHLQAAKVREAGLMDAFRRPHRPLAAAE